MHALTLALAASLALVGCTPEGATDWAPGPLLAVATPAAPTLVPACRATAPGGRTWGQLCSDPGYQGPGSADIVCCEMRRATPLASQATASAPQTPAPAPSAPPQVEAPRKAPKVLQCGAGVQVRTLRCDGSGELLRPTCKPCKGRAAKGGKRPKRHVSK